MAKFSPISLLIDIDDDYWTPESLVLRAPVKVNPEKSRIIFHETVHFWQQCSQTFLVRMAEENWKRLLLYENTGNVDPVGPLTKEYMHFYKDDGFSARDLQEGLARFWDVHVINPVTLMDIELKDKKRHIPEHIAARFEKTKQIAASIDPSGYPATIYELAMDFTAGNYAKPYIDLRDKTSSFVAQAIFPLAGHFALQTDKPVPFFSELIRRSAMDAENYYQPGIAIIDVWPKLYHQIRNLAVQIHKETSDRSFYAGMVPMARGSLLEHPVYYYVLNLVNALCEDLNKNETTREFLVPGYDHVPEIHAQLSIDFYTSCPGIPKFRSLLVSHLSPPCIRFYGGEIWKFRLEHLKESYPDMSEDEISSINKDLQTVAEQTIDLNERWRQFRLSSLGINI